MKRLLLFCIIAMTLLACKEEKEVLINELMLCGDNKVWIIDMDNSNDTIVEVLWKWENTDVLDLLPESYQKYLGTMDECKFVDSNTKLLLTASTGGVVLLDRETKTPLFYAYAPMAHSADLLPNNRIAVALSTHPKGNSIEIYDIDKPEQVIFKDTLYSGHGSVWMENRNRYYALGFDELREYSLKDWETDTPSLLLERTWKIPHRGGHDLMPVSENELILSGHKGVSIFNIDTEVFEPFEPLIEERGIKSINYNKENQSFIYTKAEEGWWTFNIYFRNPDKVIKVPEIKMYKVRPYFN
ncbi:MAG: DUF6528 family protein [Bacteroidales bacterium]|nr:DUF6528 family protein [Bacteroidales bacterium]